MTRQLSRPCAKEELVYALCWPCWAVWYRTGMTRSFQDLPNFPIFDRRPSGEAPFFGRLQCRHVIPEKCVRVFLSLFLSSCRWYSRHFPFL